jgi:hypothetical protein
MSESPVPRTTPARRLIAPALAMLAVAAVTAGAVVFAQHRGSGPGSGEAPPPLRLLDAVAAAAPETTVGYGRPTVVGALPTGPARAAVRTLPAGAAPADAVAALATALGLSGTPARAGDGWRLTDGDRTLQVAGTAGMPWALGPQAGSGGSVTCHVISTDRGRLCPPPVVVPPQPAPQGGSAGTPGSGGAGSSGSGAVGVPRPGAPPDDPGNAAGVPLPPDQAIGSPPLPIPNKPLPLPKRPTDADALTAATPVLAALGLAGAPTRVQRIPGQVSVLAEPVVDGLATSGFGTALVVAPGGTIAAGAGWLARPVKGAEYPLVGAADAVKQIAVPGVAMLCGTTVCPPRPLEITGASLGLALRWDATGRALLVPAWRYDVRGQDRPLVVIAVQPAYLGERTDRPNVPGGVPMPVDPSGAYQNGGGLPGGVAPAPPGTR